MQIINGIIIFRLEKFIIAKRRFQANNLCQFYNTREGPFFYEIKERERKKKFIPRIDVTYDSLVLASLNRILPIIQRSKKRRKKETRCKITIKAGVKKRFTVLLKEYLKV